MPNGRLHVKLLQGHDLRNQEWFGKMDVFARIGLRGAESDAYRLETVAKGGTSPDFQSVPDAGDADLHVTNSSHAQIVVELFDEEKLKEHDYIGGCRVFIDGLLWPEEAGLAPAVPVAKRKTLKLHGEDNQPAGALEVELSFRPSEAVEAAAVRDPMAEEGAAFSAQVDALVLGLKGCEAGIPRDLPQGLSKHTEQHAAGAVPLYILDSPLQATVVDLNPAMYERAAHVSICGGHFVRAFLMHGRRELGRAEDDDMQARPFHFSPLAPPAGDGEPEPQAAGDSTRSVSVSEMGAFMGGTSGEPYPCKCLPREAHLLLCVYCRRDPDETTDGDVRTDAGAQTSARVVDRDPGGGSAVLVAWSTIQVFDSDGMLRVGLLRLPLWRQRAPVPYSFRGKCQNCLEIEAAVRCPDCRSKSQLLCVDCDEAHRAGDGKKGHRSTRLPTARQTQWGSLLLRIEPPRTAVGSPAPTVAFAFDPEVLERATSSAGARQRENSVHEGSDAASSVGAGEDPDASLEGLKPFEEGLKRRLSGTPGSLNVEPLLPGPGEGGPSTPRGPSPSPPSSVVLGARSSPRSRGLESAGSAPALNLHRRTSTSAGTEAEAQVPSSGSWTAGHRRRESGGSLSAAQPSTSPRRSMSRHGSLVSCASFAFGSAAVVIHSAVQTLAGTLSMLNGCRRDPRASPPDRTLAYRLLEFLEKGNDPYWEVDEGSRRAMRANADLFTAHSHTFAKFVECLDFSRPVECAFVEQVIRSWKPIAAYDALQLLDRAFPDGRVRRYAAERIGTLADEELADYMLQLVQGLRHTTYLDGPLTRLLFWRGLRSPRVVGLPFLWALRWGVGDESEWGRRCKSLVSEFERACRSLGHLFVFDQIQFVEIAGSIATKLIDMKGSEAARRRERLWALIKTDVFERQEAGLLARTFTLPIDPLFEVRAIDRGKCRVYPSGKVPYELTFVGRRRAPAAPASFSHGQLALSITSPDGAAGSADPPPAPHSPSAEPLVELPSEVRMRAIFKAGQDLRTDELCLKMVAAMNKMWSSEGLDLKIRSYKCVSTARGMGVIEVVENAYTIGEILDEAGGSLMAFSEKALAEWLMRKAEVPYFIAQQNFAHSCAGYCVATYVLGLCDRHSDNIMLFPDGRMFHIDFGRFLGQVTKMGGIIPKETSPFLFTPDYAYVMGGEGSAVFDEFVRLCGDAFIVLRRHRNLLLHLCMLLHGRRATSSMYERFMVDAENDEEVRARFRKLIGESLSNFRAQFYNWCHLVKLSAKRALAD